MKDNYKEKVILTITLAFLSIFGLLFFCDSEIRKIILQISCNFVKLTIQTLLLGIQLLGLV